MYCQTCPKYGCGCFNLLPLFTFTIDNKSSPNSPEKKKKKKGKDKSQDVSMDGQTQNEIEKYEEKEYAEYVSVLPE